MSRDVYYQLREQLDQYSVGFRTTQSGVEMKILERLFTEEEAQIYLNLSMNLETAQSVAERTKQVQDHVADLLERMAEKGLIFRLRKGESAQYGAVPFVIGSYEFQLKTMDRELAQLVEQYFEEAFYTRQPGRQCPFAQSRLSAQSVSHGLSLHMTTFGN